tara:strand:- start:222 stop:755 length:534 start_codon:yes stop_codon:yes gene_type:complete
MDRGNDKVVKMLSISEEINTINTKVRQLVQDLHSTSGVLLNLQELTDKLSGKVTEFKKDVGSYKAPKVTKDNNGAKPSYVSEGVQPHRVQPTPDNIHELNPPEEQPKVTLDEFKKNDPLIPGDTPIKKAKPKTKKAKPPVRGKRVVTKKAKPPVNKKVNKATPPKRKSFGLFGKKES